MSHVDQIHARFSLSEVARIRCHVFDPKAPGSWRQTEGVRVKMVPVSGEPFGSATPGGQVEMVVANPLAAQMFSSATIDQQFDFVMSPVPSEE
jgi:hypothetical protein